MGHNSSQLTVLKINRKELEELVRDLNTRCQACFVNCSTLMMIFGVKYKDGDENSLTWKFSVRIRCFMTRSGTNYCKSYNLASFLKFYQSLSQILDAAECSLEAPEQNEALMQMSIFQQECCSIDGQCIICFDRRPDSVLPCAHAYCSKCVDAFHSINQDCCPLCRFKLKGSSDEAWVVTDKPDKDTIKQYLLE